MPIIRALMIPPRTPVGPFGTGAIPTSCGGYRRQHFVVQNAETHRQLTRSHNSRPSERNAAAPSTSRPSGFKNGSRKSRQMK